MTKERISYSESMIRMLDSSIYFIPSVFKSIKELKISNYKIGINKASLTGIQKIMNEASVNDFRDGCGLMVVSNILYIVPSMISMFGYYTLFGSAILLGNILGIIISLLVYSLLTMIINNNERISGLLYGILYLLIGLGLIIEVIRMLSSIRFMRVLSLLANILTILAYNHILYAMSTMECIQDIKDSKEI